MRECHLTHLQVVVVFLLLLQFVVQIKRVEKVCHVVEVDSDGLPLHELCALHSDLHILAKLALISFLV